MTGSLPPGPSHSPLRQAARWAREPLAFLEDCQARYGETFTLRLASAPPMVFVSDPAAVREVFRGDPELFRAGEGNRILEAALGKQSLLLLDGAAHLAERKLMLPPFHGERMRAYRDVMEAVAAREFARWPADRQFDTAPSFRRITLEVMARAVFGVEDEVRMERLMDALRRLLDKTASPFRLFVLTIVEPDGLVQRLWRRHSPLITRVDALIHEEIRRRRADPAAAERDDVLSMLLPHMSDEHLRDELMTLLAAGHDTTATALAWAVERLARRPDALDGLAEDDDYLDAVVKETLRLRPVLPIVLRYLAAPAEVAGRWLPQGAAVAPCIYLMHRRADVYPDPERFRPERFLERPADTYTWIPFGGGTRRCLGGAFAMFEMKTVLRALALRGRPLPVRMEDERVRRRAVTLVPEHGARIVWRPGHEARPRDTGRAMSQENVETVRRAFEAWNADDLDAFLAELDADLEWHPAIQPGLEGKATTYRGHDGAREIWRQDRGEAWERLTNRPHELRDLGESVLALGQIDLTARATGIEFSQEVGEVFDLRAGKIVRIRDFLTHAEAIEAAGLRD